MDIEMIRAARERIAPYIVTTPLLRLEALDAHVGCRVYAKAECMQRTGAFKLRGALNKLLALPKEQLVRGIVAASSGNHGRAVAYAAKMLGTKATIVMPNTAPRVKVEAIRALGAEVVPCDVTERFEVAARLCAERGAVSAPPFDDEAIMAGQGMAGLEMMEQCPGLDAVVVPVSGGGLISGVSCAVKSASPHTRVYGAEPAALPRYTASLSAGRPVSVEGASTVADALVSRKPGELCFPIVRDYVDAFADVEDAAVLRAWKLLLMEGKLLAEPSSCIGLAAVMSGLLPVSAKDNVGFVISGGSVGFEQLAQLQNVTY